MRKRKERTSRKSIFETLMRDMQGTAAQKLVLTSGFVNASAAEVAKAAKTLRAFAAMEKASG